MRTDAQRFDAFFQGFVHAPLLAQKMTRKEALQRIAGARVMFRYPPKMAQSAYTEFAMTRRTLFASLFAWMPFSNKSKCNVCGETVSAGRTVCVPCWITYFAEADLKLRQDDPPTLQQDLDLAWLIYKYVADHHPPEDEAIKSIAALLRCREPRAAILAKEFSEVLDYFRPSKNLDHCYAIALETDDYTYDYWQRLVRNELPPLPAPQRIINE